MEELVGRERFFYHDHYPDKRWFLYMSNGIWSSDNGGADDQREPDVGPVDALHPCEGCRFSCLRISNHFDLVCPN